MSVLVGYPAHKNLGQLSWNAAALGTAGENIKGLSILQLPFYSRTCKTSVKMDHIRIWWFINKFTKCKTYLAIKLLKECSTASLIDNSIYCAKYNYWYAKMTTIWTYDSRDSHNFEHVTMWLVRFRDAVNKVWGCHKRQNGLWSKKNFQKRISSQPICTRKTEKCNVEKSSFDTENTSAGDHRCNVCC